MKKSFKKILSMLSVIALMSSSFVTMQVGAEDIPYVNIFNNQGTYLPDSDSTYIERNGKAEYGKDPIMGDYTLLTTTTEKDPNNEKNTGFVHVCEGSNDVASLWASNIAAGRMTVVEADFKPDENTQLVHLYTYYTNQMTYSVDLTKLGNIVKVGEWNHVKILADTSVYAKRNNNVDISRVPSAVWVNGVQVLEMNMSNVGNLYLTLDEIKKRLEARTTQYIRLRFDAKAGTTTTVGIDNTSIKTVDGGVIFDSNYNNYMVENSKVINANASIVNGLAGKATDDKVLSLTGTTSSGYIESYVPTGTKYIVQDFDFLPGEGFVKYYTKSRNQTLTYDMLGLTTNSTESNQRIKPNQWNHMTIITEVLEYDLASGKCSLKTDAYVNGINIGAATRECNGTSSEFTDGAGRGRAYYPFRSGYQAEGVSTYYDNFKIIATNETPTVPSIGKINSIEGKILVASPTRYNNGVVTAICAEGITPADLSITDGSVRVYTDDTYKTMLANDASINNGNVIVATDANGIVTYYNFEGFIATKTTLLDINFNDQTLNGSIGKVDVQEGKNSFEIAGGKNDNALVLETIKQVVYTRFSAVQTSAKSVVIEFNVMPTDDKFDYIRVGTGWNAAIFPELKADKLVNGQWNHVVAIVNQDKKVVPNATNYTVKSSVSVNGSAFTTPIDCSPRTTADGKVDLRFIVNGKTENVPTKVLFDDIKVVSANYDIEVPDVSMPYVEASTGAVTSNTIENATFDGLSAYPEGATIKAFTDDTFSNEVTGALVNGNIIVVEKDNKYKYYTYVQTSDELSLTLDGLNYTITPRGKDAGKGIVIAAVYDKDDDDVFRGVRVYNLEKGEKPTGTLPDANAVLRAYWLESLTTMKPLCNLAQ